MRKIKIIEHISLDGVIQHSADDDFPYSDWTAPYRTRAGQDAVIAAYGERFDHPPLAPATGQARTSTAKVRAKNSARVAACKVNPSSDGEGPLAQRGDQENGIHEVRGFDPRSDG